MHTIDEVYGILDTATFNRATDSDMKRSNANVDGDTAMGAMLTYGSETARMWVDDKLLPNDVKQAVEDNLIYIHDKDFYGLTETCCQIRLDKLFEGGFHTGHGFIREPASITSAAALACIAIQSNQNEMHGGQSIPAFDWYMAKYVRMSYEKNVRKIEEAQVGKSTDEDRSMIGTIAWRWTEKETYQAMEALVHNLNTMHSRAGAQVPFSSLNYGTCTDKYGRLVTMCLLLATEKGLGHGETPIFPVQIFKVKEGVNFNEGDPNYDLFKLAIKVSSKRLFPNFSFMDAPFNAQYCVDGDPNTEVAYMGCRTRVMGNVNGDEVTGGRGNLSFTTVNLVRCALDADGEFNRFQLNVYDAMKIAEKQLLHRYKIQCARHVYNYPFLMGNGVWLDSDKLEWDDTLEGVLKHGTLSIGFIGLAEAMTAVFGRHHGEDVHVRQRAYETIASMRRECDNMTDKTGLNFSLLATPAEGLSGKFVGKDRERYGVIENVTDKEYYTNSFHVPVYYNISAADKIAIEAPFHAMCNAGHITYVELDGDMSANPEAFESVIRHMRLCDIGYGSVNHPVDRDPVCGYAGVIGDTCPVCGRSDMAASKHADFAGLGEGVPFERIRRITGYLVGTMDRWNDAKRAEERDRVKHGMNV